MPVTRTHINIIGAANFSRILNIPPKKPVPNIFFQKFGIHQPATKQINRVLKGKKIFDVE